MALKNSFLFALILLLSLPAFAQQPDTLAGKHFREVQIKASRATFFTPGSRQTNFDSTALSQQASGSVADLLQTRTPVFVKTYGQNMVATVSFRGTSASHTAVLWNGFSIAQPTLGLTDLSLLPVNSLKTVQLLHGSGSSNFGSGAIGGAILLHSGSEIKPGFKLNAQQDFGSFGRKFSQAELSWGRGKFGVETSVFQVEAQNDFPFVNTTEIDAPEERQENARQHQTGFTANVNFRPDLNNALSFRSWFTGSNIQAQPTMVSANTHARNQNKNLRLMAEWKHFSGLGTTTVRTAFFNDQMHYQDESVNSASEVQTYQSQLEHGFIIKKKLNLNVGTEMQHFAAQVSDYGRDVTENRAAVFALFRYDVSDRLALNLNWRQAFIQRFDPPPAPTLGFSLVALQSETSELHWKGNMGKGYRVPTLNDRFWPPGNENLKPEKSLNYETGLVYKLTLGKLAFEAEATGYLMHVDNWIQWMPKIGSLYAPENLKKVTSQGLEYGAKAHFNFAALKTTFGGNYAYTLARQTEVYNQTAELNGKQLVYVPYQTATAFSDLHYKNWQLSLNWQYTGRRFTTPENDRALPAYQLLSIYAGKTFRWQKFQFQVLGRVNNVTNTVYQNLEFYAMPGRHYNLSFRFQLK